MASCSRLQIIFQNSPCHPPLPEWHITWIHQRINSTVTASQTASILKEHALEHYTSLALLGWSWFFTCRAISLEQRSTPFQLRQADNLFSIQNTSLSETVAFKLWSSLCVLAKLLFIVPGVSSLTGHGALEMFNIIIIITHLPLHSVLLHRRTSVNWYFIR